MAAASVLLTTVVPALGALISILMYAAPLKAVVKAESFKSLGDLNAIPFAVTVANTIVWLTYGLLKADPFITSPNVVGVPLALFYVFTTYALADEQVRGRVRQILCAEGVILPLMGVATVFACKTAADKELLWGLGGNCISLVYYSAPLSTMAQVIKTRNSASILLPLTLMNLTNALLWTTYGLATIDIYVWAPNGIGALLSLAQLALAMLFPARPGSAGAGGAGLGDRTHNASEDLDADERSPLKV